MHDQTENPIHDGQRVRARLADSNLTQLEFNKQMAWSEKRVYKMLNQPSWKTGDLVKAGKVLGYNFFLAYGPGAVSQLAETIRIPIGALTDPQLITSLREEIIALADEFRKQDKPGK